MKRRRWHLRAARAALNALLLAGGVAALTGTAIILPLLLTDAYRHAHLPLVHGAVFAFLSHMSSLGKGLQKAGVVHLPELSLSRPVIRQYLSSRMWRAGMALDILGALCGLGSITILPISIAQPIFCNGLVVLALYSHLYLSEQLGRLEWFSIVLCFVGSLLLAVTLVPRDWAQTDIRWIQVKLFVAIFAVLPLLGFLEVAARYLKRRVDRRTTTIEVIAGMQAGLCIGVGNAALATGLQSTSRSWRAHLATNTDIGTHLLFAGCFIVFGAGINASHPIFANRGYAYGRVMLISTYTSLISMISGVFMGAVILDEPWPMAPRMSILRQLAFFLIFWGVVLLNGKSISHSFRQRFEERRYQSPWSATNPRGSGGESGGGGGEADERPLLAKHKRHMSDPPDRPQMRELTMDMPDGVALRLEDSTEAECAAAN